MLRRGFAPNPTRALAGTPRPHSAPAGRARARLSRGSNVGQANASPGKLVPVDRVGGKRRQTDGHILGAAWLRAAVADPLARRGDDRLTGPDVERARLGLNPQKTAEHDGNLFEVGPLARLDPALRRHHPGDTDAIVPGIHAPGIFLDPLGEVPRRLDDSRALDESGHGRVLEEVRRPKSGESWSAAPASRLPAE